MKKETGMNLKNTFTAEVSPEIFLIDVAGHRSTLAGPHLAVEGIRIANRMQELLGTARTVPALVPGVLGDDAENRLEEAVLLYYRTPNGRPSRTDIARAAAVIARSALREPVSNGEAGIRVSGTRAVVYPRRVASEATCAVLLVSTRVWYNENRSVTHFPATTEQRNAMLDDINARLLTGEVSLPR
jgi:hypothetical protein